MSSNSTCFHKPAALKSPPLIQNGKVVIQIHHVGWITTGAFAFLATVISFWLVNKHLQFYTNKHEQRYIVRILFMVPIYSLVSFTSYLFWNEATPLLLLRDCYESTVLTAFFYLLLLYLSPDSDEQRAIFLKVGLSKENDRQSMLRGEPVRKWVFPLGSIKSKPADGLYFLQMMKWGILQYCIIRPVTTLVAVILDYFGLYCEDSWSPGWGHVYIVTVVSISVSIAMYCLIQVYVPISKQLALYKPLLKLFAIKAVVFLTFWQATFLSVLSSLGVVKDTKYMTADDINIGIGAILETVEMAFFAILHIKAFTYKPYQRRPEERSAAHIVTEDIPRTPRLRSLLHAFDFRDTCRELWEGVMYICRRWRGAETDAIARRIAIRQDIFGGESHMDNRTKRSNRDPVSKKCVRYDPVSFEVEVEKEVHVGSRQPQWISTSDDDIYELRHPLRERSVGLGEQIEMELERRGYGASSFLDVNCSSPPQISSSQGRRQRSWWRRALDQISRTSLDDGSGARVLQNIQEEPCQVDRTFELMTDAPVYPPDSPSNSSTLPSQVEIRHHSPIALSNNHGQDSTLTRLFSTRQTSELSGPTSATHLSSYGNHIRLTSPASITPANDPLAHRPTLIIPPASFNVLSRSGEVRSQISTTRRNKG